MKALSFNFWVRFFNKRELFGNLWTVIPRSRPTYSGTLIIHLLSKTLIHLLVVQVVRRSLARFLSCLFSFKKQSTMLLTLPFELVLEIIKRLDYTCFPKMLHINREIRVLVLENWLEILQARGPTWRDHIPDKRLGILSHRYWLIPNRRASYRKKENWMLRKPGVVQDATRAMILKGVQLDYQPKSNETFFQKCIQWGYFDLADIRKLFMAHCSSC